MRTIITIGREFGSGGRELGRRIAEELNIEYYDKEILSEIAKRTELSEQYVKQVVENTPHNLFPITVGHTLPYFENYSISNVQAVFREQTNVIKDLAEKSDCVIVGRCADYILEKEKPFKIFVYSDTESKLLRIKSRMKDGEIYNEKKIKKEIKRIDKNRSRYYEFYTGKKWGDKLSYDLCVNTSSLNIKEIAKTIAKLFK